VVRGAGLVKGFLSSLIGMINFRPIIKRRRKPTHTLTGRKQEKPDPIAAYDFSQWPASLSSIESCGTHASIIFPAE
jgi:hypothetical protein